jgi:hypothetical protein|tara:strand:- start:96 stop:347 length:252 start_codon:yes stop_codon:yes gene_type:complete
MGGFFRAVTRIFKKPQSVVIQQAPAQQVAQTVDSTSSKKLSIGKGMASTGTLMNDATGIEEEANVSKTVLGGAVKKNKKYKKA